MRRDKLLAIALLGIGSPFLLWASNLPASTYCQIDEENNQVIAIGKKSDAFPLLLLAGLAQGAAAGYLFWSDLKKDNQQRSIGESKPIGSLPQSIVQELDLGSNVIRFPEPETVAANPFVSANFQSLNSLKSQTQSEDWIKNMVFDENDELKTVHYHLSGPTGTGKTTLGEHLMGLIRGDSKDASYYLINPKHLANKPSWSFPPFVKDIDQALEGIEYCADLVKKRVADPDFYPDTAPPIFVIVDEWDWIFGVYKARAVNAIRTIFKVGREVKVYLFVCGQSAQAQGTGLNGTDYRQMARIVLGTEAIAFLDNPQFIYKNKQELYPLAENYQESKTRYALRIPMEGLPKIKTIPHISKPTIEVKQLDTLEQSLPKDLRAILNLAVKRGGEVNSRIAQQAKLPECEGMNAEDFRYAFSDLQSLGKGVVEGDGAMLIFRVLDVGEEADTPSPTPGRVSFPTMG
ncbi:hypothetical protein [Kamptonema sp. UHCC 0994]|uniref:hypothetical protein n=1 Tax=Kamptonema sp. UHCC 0994 TaxID=3031329 RepID=UPI0023B9E8BA|nr:hypothetical protein [Kamptonema sp. UHCC 0994]MDF0552194.1 hypothetical protein [Kamptonema sp. UHCC 0994]